MGFPLPPLENYPTFLLFVEREKIAAPNFTYATVMRFCCQMTCIAALWFVLCCIPPSDNFSTCVYNQVPLFVPRQKSVVDLCVWRYRGRERIMLLPERQALGRLVFWPKIQPGWFR